MNKYRKIIITSCCLIGAGLVLSLAGYMAGGKIMIVKNNIGYTSKDDYKRISEIKSLEEFNNIKIDVNYLDNVQVVKGEEYKIEVNYSERTGKIDYKVEDKNLIVSQLDTKGTVGFDFGFINNKSDYIKIYVPQDKDMKDIIVKSNSSDIEVKDVVGDNVSILCNYGDIDLNNISSNDMSVKANSGDIQMKDIKGGLVEVVNSYGDSSFETINSKDFIVEIKSGDIDVSDIEILENFKVNNSYGSVDMINSNINKMTAYISSGDISVNNSNIVDTNIDNSYGDIKYSTNNLENLYNYSLNCNYGEINVNGRGFGDTLEENNNGERNITINSKSGDIKLTFK